MPRDIVGERRAGAEISLPFWPAHVAKYDLANATETGRIEAWDPPRLFSWTWGGDLLVFELKPRTDGTTLTFTTWFASPDADGAADAAGGYHVCLDHLRTLLDTGSATPLADADVEARRWEPAYAERLGIAGR